MVKNGSQILPRWTLQYEEVSNNVFKVSIKDDFGRISSVTEMDFFVGLAKAEKHAYEIEMFINDYPNKFLFDYFLLKLKDYITDKNESNAYGSWGIQTQKKRLMLDGRDDLLISQEYEDNSSAWVSHKMIRIKDLNFEEFKAFLEFMVQKAKI
jgi:hypothetical protein